MKFFGWIFLFFIMIYIVPLGSRPMIIPDECRYAEIPREMLASGDLTTPRLLGMRYFEKPPMQYWLTAGSFRLFGENAFATRLPSALAVGITAILIALLVRQALRDEKLAHLSAMIYMSCGLVYGLGTTAVTDNVFTMFVTGAHGLLFLAIQERKINRRKLLLLALGGIFIGCGFLTKGFLAFVIPGMTVCAYLLWTRRWREFLILPLPILIFALLPILPWGIAIHRAQDDFWHYFVVVEHLNRATGGAEAQHAAPWWYFLPFLPLGLLPAGLFVPPALAIGRAAWKEILKQEVFLYALFALILPFVFFSACHGKLPTYILPCFPPAALLIAAGVQAYFNVGGHHRAYNWVMSAWGYLMLIVGVFGIGLWYFRHLIPEKVLREIPLSVSVLITGGVAAFCCGALMLYSLRGNWRGRMYLFFFGLVLLPLGVSWCITPSRKMPEAIIARFLAELEIHPGRTMMVTNGGNAGAVAWTCRKSDVKLFSLGELEYGNNAALRHGEEPAQVSVVEVGARIADPKRNYPVAVILREGDRRLQQLPAPGRSVTHRRMTCYLYPAAAPK